MRLIAGLLACGLTCAAWPQTPQTPPQTPPTFRGRVDLVPLDVSVWDKDHNPVKDLTADKFTLLEDNKPREIVTFAAVDIPDPPVPTAAWMRDAVKDVETNDVKDRRLFMILVDDASFGDDTLAPSRLEKLKEIARTAIRHLAPSDLAAVFFTGDNRRSQEFTTDHGRLLAAVNGMVGATLPSVTGPSGRGSRGFSLSAIYSVTVIERAVESLLRTPGHRKAFVDITKFDTPWVERIPGMNTDHLYYIGRTEAMFEEAQRAGVNVYMMGPDKSILDPPYWEGQWFRRVAHETGGAWFGGDLYDPRVAEQAVTRIFQANSSYYILGYSSADLQKFHFIKVAVDMPGAEVRTREKYYWPDPEKPPPGPPPPPLTKSIAGVLPNSDVVMRTNGMAFASKGVSGATLAVVTSVHLTPPADLAASNLRLETFDLGTRLFTAEGAARGSVTTQASVRRTGRDVDTEVFSQIDVPKPGLYELRLSVHRPAVSLNGSVYTTVDVPDFAKLPVSFSSVVVSTAEWPSFGPRDELAKLLPAQPTTQREFGRGDRARAYVRVYQGGKSALTAVDIRIRIVDDHDKTVLDRSEKLASTRFSSGRSADVRVDLPTTTLAPGPYLLRFDSAMGKTTAYREVRFSVR